MSERVRERVERERERERARRSEGSGRRTGGSASHELLSLHTLKYRLMKAAELCSPPTPFLYLKYAGPVLKTQCGGVEVFMDNATEPSVERTTWTLDSPACDSGCRPRPRHGKKKRKIIPGRLIDIVGI